MQFLLVSNNLVLSVELLKTRSLARIRWFGLLSSKIHQTGPSGCWTQIAGSNLVVWPGNLQDGHQTSPDSSFGPVDY